MHNLSDMRLVLLIKKLGIAMGTSRDKIEGCESEIEKLRIKKSAFTRNRKLGAARMLRILIVRIYRALQLCIDDYFEDFCIGEEPVSKQAFSQARQNLDPEYIRSFADMTSELAALDKDMPNYKGMRLIAIDGSRVALENSEELKREYGCSGPNKDAATALCSIAYGPLDHAIYDFRIDRYDKDERELAMQHLEHLTQLGLEGSLLLFDRGYPSAEFISAIIESGFQYVMRVRKKWNLEADAIGAPGQKKINIYHDGKDYSVRVLKIKIPTKEGYIVETLLTSLNQKQLPIRSAGALYFERWRVETDYDLIKSKLQLENFSGKTKVSVEQDFYATIYIANLVAFAAEEAGVLIKAKDEGRELKYQRKANHNRTIYKLRKKFIQLLMEPDIETRTKLLDRLLASIARWPVSIVPGRSPERKPPRNKDYYQTKKSVV